MLQTVPETTSRKQSILFGTDNGPEKRGKGVEDYGVKPYLQAPLLYYL